MAAQAQLDTRIEIVTPENISFQYQLAGPFRRLLAYLIDLVIRAIVLGILGLILMLTLGLVGLGGVGLAGWLIAVFVIDVFYGGLFETFMNGQTPGKKALGIRVVSTDGLPVQSWQVMFRNLARVVDMMPAFTFQLGLLAMTISRRQQRLGDLLCKTMVIVEQTNESYGVTRITDPAAIELAANLPANFEPSKELAEALADYVAKRKRFTWARLTAIARHVGEPLRARFQLPPGTNYDLLLCALYHRVFIAERSQDEATIRAHRPPPLRQAPLGAPFAASNGGVSFPPAGAPQYSTSFQQPSIGPPPGWQ